MLRIAVQAKGRLNEDSMELLKEIGIKVDDTKRKFLSKASNFPVELLFLRDDDIPQIVEKGTAQLGIVGLNEVKESGRGVKVVDTLGFGGCRISLAIDKNIKYEGPRWFNGKRIATSYPNILKEYLDANNIKAEVEVITGSVEIAPAAGIADAIFDIVSSGGTLVSNGLVEVEKIFFSEAALISGNSLTPEDQAILEEILFRIESAKVSKGKKYVVMNIPNSSLEEAIKLLPAMRSPTILPLAAEGWSAMHTVVPTSDLWEKIRQLKAIGAEGILVMNVDKMIP